MSRTAIGVLFIALIGNGFNLLGVDPLYQQIVLGVILLRRRRPGHVGPRKRRR